MYNEELLPDGQSIVTPKFHYYVNHSCEPTALDMARSPNVTQYIAWRDIRAQEEVTTDYGLIGAAIKHCLCGSPSCRGRVTPNDWRLAKLQQQYRGYFPWHMDREIRQAKEQGDESTPEDE